MVWEGRSREALPYPDLWPDPEAAAVGQRVRCLGYTRRGSNVLGTAAGDPLLP